MLWRGRLTVQVGTTRAGLGPEALRYDSLLAQRPPHLSSGARDLIWASAEAVLRHGPVEGGDATSLGLALGYVQSGKTTAFSALAALAADRGYGLVVAFLGGTRLLLDQNRSRLEVALGLDERSDYVWQSLLNPKGAAGGREVAEYLRRGRLVVLPVLAARALKLSRSATSVLRHQGVGHVDASTATVRWPCTRVGRHWAAQRPLVSRE